MVVVFLEGVLLLLFFLLDWGVLSLECGVVHAKDPLEDSDPVGEVRLESLALWEGPVGVFKMSCVSLLSSSLLRPR